MGAVGNPIVSKLIYKFKTQKKSSFLHITEPKTQKLGSPKKK